MNISKKLTKTIQPIHHKILLLLSLIFLSYNTSYAEAVRVQHVVAEAFSDHNAITPGQTFRVGIQLSLDEGWHVYWKNPGDSGQATVVEWPKDTDISFTNTIFPTPYRIDMSPFMEYGYKNELFITTEATTSYSHTEGEKNIPVKVFFLMCKDICLPGEVELSIPLAVSGKAEKSIFFSMFDDIKKQHPLSSEDWQPTIYAGEDSFYFSFTDDNQTKSIRYIIPSAERMIEDATPQKTFIKNNKLYWKVPKDFYAEAEIKTFEGLIVTTKGTSYSFSSPIQAAPFTDMPPEAKPVEFKTRVLGESSLNSLPVALFFAFIAGLILNLMPCVLPVLSIKILGLLHHSKQDKAWLYGVAYALGVLTTFTILSSVLVGLKSVGMQVGWGFQLQNPSFVAGLTALLFLISLNMFGVFHIGTSLGRVQNLVGNEKGIVTTFLTGMLITVVSTPCTVPFMGGAVAYSLSQTGVTTYLIFAVMALGLSFPYLIFTSAPKLLKYLPKPGAWELRLQQFLAFPMLATALWLSWVYARQTDVQMAFALISGLFALSFGAWILGQYAILSRGLLSKTIAWAIFIASITFYVVSITPRLINAESQAHQLEWEAWSPQKVNEGLEQERPVFINFTADWCITCKMNEVNVLESSELIQLFETYGVLSLKGDWTKRNKNISKELEKHNRNGVPLYLLYIPAQESIIVLPQILSVEDFSSVLSPS